MKDMKRAAGPDPNQFHPFEGTGKRCNLCERELFEPVHREACRAVTFTYEEARVSRQPRASGDEMSENTAAENRYLARIYKLEQERDQALAKNARLREELEGYVIVQDQDGNGSPIWTCELCDAFASETGTIRHTCALADKGGGDADR